MSFDAKTQAILSFLQAQAAAAPELAGEYAQMEDLYKRKLRLLPCDCSEFRVSADQCGGALSSGGA